jgi:hypothetical protein
MTKCKENLAYVKLLIQMRLDGICEYESLVKPCGKSGKALTGEEKLILLALGGEEC